MSRNPVVGEDAVRSRGLLVVEEVNGDPRRLESFGDAGDLEPGIPSNLGCGSRGIHRLERVIDGRRSVRCEMRWANEDDSGWRLH